MSSPTTAARSPACRLPTRPWWSEALRSAAAAEAEVAALPPFRRAEILIARPSSSARARTELARQMTLETGNAVWETRVRGAADGRDPAARRRGGEAERLDRRARARSTPSPGARAASVSRAASRSGPCSRSPRSTPRCSSSRTSSGRRSPPAVPASCGPRRRRRSSALSLGEIMLEAGAPPAAGQRLPCRTELAERMVDDERVKMLSFTGQRGGRLAPAEGRGDTPRDARARRQRRGHRRARRESRLRRRALRVRRLPPRRPGVHLRAASLRPRVRSTTR